jgi:TonB-dependent SusC/RagA subfamily outer membrane receptor
MTPTPSRTHRVRTAPAVALLIAVGVIGCHGNPPPMDRTGAVAVEGTQNRANTLEREEMSKVASSMEELLSHRFPGVLIRRSGGQSWVEIRGPGSISASNEALIVIDGVQNSTRGLLAMNPDDVHRIQVLKGAPASIYGIRGGNGVLVVTTRRQGQ